MRGVDRVTTRPDGSVDLDIRETLKTHRGAISRRRSRLRHPQAYAAHLRVIKGCALFRTAVPEYAADNDAVIAVEGTVGHRHGIRSTARFSRSMRSERSSASTSSRTHLNHAAPPGLRPAAPHPKPTWLTCSLRTS